MSKPLTEQDLAQWRQSVKIQAHQVVVERLCRILMARISEAERQSLLHQANQWVQTEVARVVFPEQGPEQSMLFAGEVEEAFQEAIAHLKQHLL